MKHAKHAADCRCAQCEPSWGLGPPTLAYAYFQPWNYPETHARHQRAEP